MLTQHKTCIHLMLSLNHVLLQNKRLNRLGGRLLQTVMIHQLKFLLSPSAQKLYNYNGKRGKKSFGCLVLTSVVAS